MSTKCVFVENHYRTSERNVVVAKGQVELWAGKFSNVSVIFDIGANVGVYSVLFARHFPNATVVAFEPIPLSFQMLERHRVLNCLQECLYCYRYALWCSVCTLTLGMPSKKKKKIMDTGRYSVHECLEPFEVQAVPLGLWCEHCSIMPDLIKIDVEGSEWEVLKNEDGVLRSCRWIVIEDRHYSDKVAPVWGKLAELGFVEVPGLTRKIFESDRVFENTSVVKPTLKKPFCPHFTLEVGNVT